MKPDIESYLRACVDALVANLDSTYYGRILSHLDFVPSTAVPEFAVSPDGQLLYNPTITSLAQQNKQRTIRDLLHEASHIALEHFARKDYIQATGSNAEMFNVAADCAIEAMLDKDFPYTQGDPVHHQGLERCIPKEQWGTLSTEEMYATLKQSNPSQKDPQPMHLPSLSPQGKQRLNNAMQQASAEAVEAISQEAMKQAATNTEANPQGGKVDVPKSVLEMLNFDPQQLNCTSFDSIAALFKKTYGRGEPSDDSVFNQRNMLRRTFNDAPLVGRHQRTEVEKDGDVQEWHNDVVIYSDVSGSMPKSAILRGFELILKLASEYGVAPVTVHTYNTRIVESFVINKDTDFRKLNFRIGGGTNIENALKEKVPKNKLVFILTDMEDTPLTKWNHEGEVIWLIHQNRDTRHSAFVGKKIYINDIVR